MGNKKVGGLPERDQQDPRQMLPCGEFVKGEGNEGQVRVKLQTQGFLWKQRAFERKLTFVECLLKLYLCVNF